MKNSHPLVSVIMCVYNTPQNFLYEAVKSILEQTYDNLELIIVDDHSSKNLFTDKMFKSNKIRILFNTENHGPSYSRNRALEISSGKYVAIMDSDDISLPTRIEKQVKFMEENNNIVACGTWFKFIGYKSHEVKRVIDDNEYYRCCLFFDNVPTLLNSSVMIRKEILDENQIKYDECLRYGEDYKMWCQLSKIGIITNYKEVLVYYRVHDNQMTQSKNYPKQRKNSRVDNGLMKELGVNFSEEEKDLFFDFLKSKKYNANRYVKLLCKIAEANKVSGLYDQKKFEFRIHEQWVSVVQHLNNPFKLLMFFVKQKGHRNEILRIKAKQLFKK